MVTDRNYIVYLEQFSFNNSEAFEAKFYRGTYREPGNYSLSIKLFSDCYFGLDIEKIVKFSVKQTKKIEDNVGPEEDLDQ